MTTDPLDLEINNLEHQIAALQQQKQARLAEAARPWPKRVFLPAAVHSESLSGIGASLGLVDDALRMFTHAVTFTIEVDVAQDGRVDVVSAH